jgi:hypothetical protein
MMYSSLLLVNDIVTSIWHIKVKENFVIRVLLVTCYL